MSVSSLNLNVDKPLGTSFPPSTIYHGVKSRQKSTGKLGPLKTKRSWVHFLLLLNFFREPVILKLSVVSALIKGFENRFGKNLNAAQHKHKQGILK